MTDLTVTFNTVSLPTGTSGTVTVYEDDSGGSVADRSSSVSLTNGQTEYTLTGFDGSAGNTVWPEVDLDNTDVTATGSTVELLSVEPVITSTQIGTTKIQTASGPVEVPVFTVGDSATGVIEAFRVSTPSGTGFIPLTNTTDAAYGYIRVQTGNGTLAVHNSASI